MLARDSSSRWRDRRCHGAGVGINLSTGRDGASRVITSSGWLSRAGAPATSASLTPPEDLSPSIDAISVGSDCTSAATAGYFSPVYFVGSQLYGAIYHAFGKQGAFATMSDV